MPISTTSDACGGGSSGRTVAGITGRSSKAQRHIRRSLVGALIFLLASCAESRRPARRRCRFHAPGIRQLGMGAGHCPHLGRSGAAGPADCRHRRPRHHLRHAARRIAGQRRPDRRRRPRLRADAHRRAAVRRPPDRPPIPGQDGKPVPQGRRLGHRADARLPYSVPEAIVFLAGLAGMPIGKFTIALRSAACRPPLRSRPSVPALPIDRSWC